MLQCLGLGLRVWKPSFFTVTALTDENLDDVGCGELGHVVEPATDVEERFATCHIVAENYAICASVVALRDCSETFLATRIL